MPNLRMIKGTYESEPSYGVIASDSGVVLALKAFLEMAGSDLAVGISFRASRDDYSDLGHMVGHVGHVATSQWPEVPFFKKTPDMASAHFVTKVPGEYLEHEGAGALQQQLSQLKDVLPKLFDRILPGADLVEEREDIYEWFSEQMSAKGSKLFSLPAQVGSGSNVVSLFPTELDDPNAPQG